MHVHLPGEEKLVPLPYLWDMHSGVLETILRPELASKYQGTKEQKRGKKICFARPENLNKMQYRDQQSIFAYINMQKP